MKSKQHSPRTVLLEFTQQHLKTMLQELDIGRIRLPYYHRDWCWSNDRILDLIESIGQGDPMGSLFLVYEAPVGHRAFAGVSQPFMDVSPACLVLDGQQRLTAAHQACYAAKPVKIMARTQPEHRLFFFDMKKAVSSQARLKRAILSIVTNADGNSLQSDGIDYTDPQIQFKKGIFPINQVFNYTTYIRQYQGFWENNKNVARRSQALETLRDFSSTVLASFENYEIQIEKLRRPMDANTLRRLYVTLNQPT